MKIPMKKQAKKTSKARPKKKLQRKPAMVKKKPAKKSSRGGAAASSRAKNSPPESSSSDSEEEQSSEESEQSSSRDYDASDSEEVEALWAKWERDGMDKETIAQLRKERSKNRKMAKKDAEVRGNAMKAMKSSSAGKKSGKKTTAGGEKGSGRGGRKKGGKRKGKKQDESSEDEDEESSSEEEDDDDSSSDSKPARGKKAARKKKTPAMKKKRGWRGSSSSSEQQEEEDEESSSEDSKPKPARGKKKPAPKKSLAVKKKRGRVASSSSEEEEEEESSDSPLPMKKRGTQSTTLVVLNNKGNVLSELEQKKQNLKKQFRHQWNLAASLMGGSDDFSIFFGQFGTGILGVESDNKKRKCIILFVNPKDVAQISYSGIGIRYMDHYDKQTRMLRWETQRSDLKNEKIDFIEKMCNSKKVEVKIATRQSKLEGFKVRRTPGLQSKSSIDLLTEGFVRIVETCRFDDFGSDLFPSSHRNTEIAYDNQNDIISRCSQRRISRNETESQ